MNDLNKLVTIDPNNTNNAYSFKNLGNIRMNVIFQDRYEDSSYDERYIENVNEIQIYPPHFDEEPYNTIVFVTANETDYYSISDMIRIKLKNEQIYSVETNGSNVTVTTMHKGVITNGYYNE